MDSRFERVWSGMHEERRRGTPLSAVLRRHRAEDLVAALAAAGRNDPVAANAIATELLNRLRRAPYLGSFAVSVTTVALIFALDYLYTGTFLILDSGARAYLLVGISLLIALVSLASYHMWRGRLRGLHFALRPPRRF